MAYRTKTYIAADWDNDKDAVDQLHKWNDSEYWGLSFNDAHDLTQSSDDSLACSIKDSLAKRLDVSKKFVIIIGGSTKSRRAGECNYCYKLDTCTKSKSNKSYLEYECDKAVRDDLDIVVLYNAAMVNRNKCLDAVKDIGTHSPMKRLLVNGSHEWDYQAVKTAMGQ